MISQFFSSESRKAWIAGVLGALTSPLLDILRGNLEITPKTVLVAIGLGAVTAVTTYCVPNAKGPLPWQEPLDPRVEDITATQYLPAVDYTQEIPAVGGLPSPYTDQYGQHAGR